MEQGKKAREGIFSFSLLAFGGASPPWSRISIAMRGKTDRRFWENLGVLPGVAMDGKNCKRWKKMETQDKRVRPRPE